MKIIETIIDSFGSMTPNLRENTYDFALSCHFNIFRHGVLTPQPSYITFTDGSEKVVKFLYAKAPSSVYNLYGLGVDGATTTPKLFKASLGDIAWTASTAGAQGARAENVFFEYKDYAYCWQAGTHLSQIGLLTNANPTFTDTYKAIAYTNVAQPIHHKADDCAYFFEDNNVHRLNDTTFDGGTLTPVLVLPTNMKIIGAAAYGNYLAIVCAPIELGATNSVMYLWDRDSSLTTLTSKIDLGMSEVIHVCEAEDGGIWITQQARRTSGITSLNNYITVKYYNGYFLTLEIPVKNVQDYFSSINLTGNSVEERGVFYFPAEIITTGAAETRNVIFAARRRGERIELMAEHEITGVTANQNINGIFSVGGIWFISYDTAAQTLQQRVASTFATGTYESRIFNDGDASLTKKLIGITVMTSPMPITSTISLYYRKDEETAWTLIFTQTATAAGSVSHSAINIEASGANLPQYKEIQFKITSQVGSEITAFKYRSEVLDRDIY